MLSSMILLVAVATVSKGDVRETPYEPSGWKPSGATFLLPTRNHAIADQVNNGQLPPLALSSPTINSSPNTNFFPSSHSIPEPPLPAPSNRQFVPVFRELPALIPDGNLFTTPPTLTIDYVPSVPKDRSNLGRTNPEDKDDQSFVHQLESVLSLVRPLQDASRSDDPTPLHDQPQSRLPKQYMPSPASDYETTASLRGFSPQANYGAPVTSYSPNRSAGDEFTYEVPPTEEHPVNNQQPSFVASSDESQLTQQTQRIFLVVLPVRQATSTEPESKKTQGFPSSSEAQLQEKSSVNQAPIIRFPRKLIL